MSTVIDLSSDDETTIPPTQEQSNKQTLDQLCQVHFKKIKSRNKNKTLKPMTKKDSDFLDFVVMIWLTRVRQGYRNVIMPEYIYRVKRREAAVLMDLDDSHLPKNWIKNFRKNYEKMKDYCNGIKSFKNHKVVRIEEILKEEIPKYYAEKEENERKKLKEREDEEQRKLSQILEEQKKHLELLKEAQKRQLAQKEQLQQEAEKQKENDVLEQKRKSNTISPVSVAAKKLRSDSRKSMEMKKSEADESILHKPLSLNEQEQNGNSCEVIDVDDVLDEPIQSYQEALDVMSLLENYYLSSNNLETVCLIIDIENHLKNKTIIG